MSYPVMATSEAERAVLRERERQRLGEGWTEGHDDLHKRGELLSAAICYAMRAVVTAKLIEAGTPPDDIDALSGKAQVPGLWPFSAAWWKPKTRNRDLVRAAALIIAELERIEREGAAAK